MFVSMNAGVYARQYACQFAWNSAVILNGLENDYIGLDYRTTAPIPVANNGLFGPIGNGGNLGRRLLRSLGFKSKDRTAETTK